MTAQSLQSPLPTFTGLDGLPLQGGYVYFGSVNQDPRSYPVVVYWDEALTLPATQPLRTTAGYLSRNGAPATVWIDGSCSIMALDPTGRQVLYQPAWAGFVGAAAAAAAAAASGYSTAASGSATSAASSASAAATAAATALAAGKIFATTAKALSKGVATYAGLVAGSGGTNGTFDLAFSGGAGSGAAGRFVVAGGAVASITITASGDSYTSAPAISFAASAGLAGASATAVIANNADPGEYFYVPSTVQNESLILYLNSAGTAVEQKRYASVDAINQSISWDASATAQVNANRARLSPNGSLPGPEGIFGSNLIAYFGPWSRRVKADLTEPPSETNVVVDKVYGAGTYDTFNPAADSGGTVISRYANGGQQMFYLANSVGAGYVTVPAAAGAGAALFAGDNPSVHVLFVADASTTKGQTVLFSSGNLTVDVYNKFTVTTALGVRLLVGGVVKYEWLSTDDYATVFAAGVRGFPGARVSFHWRNGAPVLKINGKTATTITATPGTTFTAGDITIGPLIGIYAAALAKDGMQNDGERLHDYHNQTTYPTAWVYDLDVEGYLYKPSSLRPARKDRQALLPVTLAGPHKDVSRLTLGSTVAGNLPVPTIPGAPNVAPWNAAHDRSIVDASLYRFSLLTHPDFPSDPTKLLMHGSAIFMPSDGAYYHTPVCYESLDSGASFNRLALNLYAYPPGANTGIARNYTQPYNTSCARTLDLTPWFPNGIYIPSLNQSFKYLWHKELDASQLQNATLWGFNDPRVPSSWVQIPVREHCWPHPYDGTAANDTLVSYGQEITTNTPNVRRKYRVEEKGVHYDPVSNRFFRFTRLWGIGFTNTAQPTQNMRQMYIAWSREGDPTRWPKELLQPLVLSNDLGYQDYDCGEPLQLKPNLWLIPVHAYADLLTGLDGSNYPNPANPALTNYQLNLKMWTDMYVSYDQLRTPPILARAQFATPTANTDVDWNGSWSLIEFGHSLKKNMYMIGGKRRHDTGAYTPDFELKLSKITYAFPTDVVPDRQTATGWLATQPFDARKVRGLRVEKASNSRVRARLLDPGTGRPIPGMELHDSMTDDSQIIRWNWSERLPATNVIAEIWVNNAAISGVYPIMD